MKPVSSAAEDHLRRLVEALARLVHVDAEAVVLHACQPAPHAEEVPAVAEMVEQDIFSTTRSGSFQGRITAAEPSWMRWVRPAR